VEEKMKALDLKGNRYGRLVVQKRVGSTSNGKSLWECRCACGNTVEIIGSHLTTGNTVSCGCVRRERTGELNQTHRLSKHPLYEVWCGMKARCYQENHVAFGRYGGKGVRVCKEWLSFENFYKWSISNGYSKGLTIDRIDSDGDYEPNNCRWTTYLQQGRNTSRNHLVTVNGISKPLSVWSEENGIKYGTILSRIRKGWDERDAVTVPPLRNKNRKASEQYMTEFTRSYSGGKKK
jgi:hypothetical protein